ncbi:unnamed protein product [Mycena citricolor]|uniref:Uncharacterized protein n=1 Tax=Mycena citricolor TaxID=2018698 RepID=A0AAD2HW05_9AGAR|nr:unnamed protein product [Mycena citricolor]
MPGGGQSVSAFQILLSDLRAPFTSVRVVEESVDLISQTWSRLQCVGSSCLPSKCSLRDSVAYGIEIIRWETSRPLQAQCLRGSAGGV